jgi:carboxypeptidase T
MKNTLRRGLAAVAAIAALSAHAHGEENVTHVIEIPAKTVAERSAVAALGYAPEEFRSDKIFVYGHAEDAEIIRKGTGLAARAHEAKPEWFGVQNATAARFTSLAEAEALLEKAERDFPALASRVVIGRSVENRPIIALRLSGKSLADAENAKLPVVFYMGCHHAREHLSVEMPLLWIQYLTSNYGKNPDVTRLLDSREVYVTPIVNPDGHFYDYTNGIRGRMWRKNRRPNNGGTFGVDLNRNYGFAWNQGGSSSNPSSETYMGTAPFSEPETQAIRDFVNSQPRMTTMLSLHTFSELVLYPWGYSNDAIGDKAGNKADLPVFEKMARTMAGWNKYTPQQSSDLYIASGDTTDWAYGQHGIFAFTFELDPTNMFEGGFYPSPTVTDAVFAKNLRPFLYLLEFADNPHRTLTQPTPSFLMTPAKAGVAMASFGDVQL